MDTRDEYDLLSAEISFLKKDVKISRNILDKAQILFHEQFMKKMGYTSPPEHNKNNTQFQKSPKISEYSQKLSKPIALSPKKKKDPKLKDIFKKIAQEVHPDKMLKKPEFEKNYKKNLYDNAIIALEEDDYFTLCEIAKKLKLSPITHSEETIEFMRKTVNNLKLEQKEIKNSIVWTWHNSSSAERKQIIMEKYIEYYKSKKNNSRP